VDSNIQRIVWFVLLVRVVCFVNSVFTTPEKFENAALFQSLGLRSTLIRQKTELSNTPFKPKGFENASFAFFWTFSCGQESFLKRSF